ncbi:hypothetical protein HAX54_039057, partial [Datura stramonium]|nr:hypothetical protein [Datura stramonium]
SLLVFPHRCRWCAILNLFGFPIRVPLLWSMVDSSGVCSFNDESFYLEYRVNLVDFDGPLSVF